MTNKGKYPALPYQRALLQFAESTGMKMWTAKQRMKVIAAYELFISKLN